MQAMLEDLAPRNGAAIVVTDDGKVSALMGCAVEWSHDGRCYVARADNGAEARSLSRQAAILTCLARSLGLVGEIRSSLDEDSVERDLER